MNFNFIKIFFLSILFFNSSFFPIHFDDNVKVNPETALSIVEDCASEFLVSGNEPGSGYTLEFDGSADYVSFSKVFLSSGLTYSAWIKTTSTDVTSGYAGNAALNIIGDHTNDIWNSFGVHGGFVRYSHYNSGWMNVTGSTLVNDGKWHHVAVTHNQSTNAIAIYVDGMQDATGSIVYGTAKTGYDRIGGSYLDASGTADFFDGTIDEVGIYSTALSQTEIRDWMCKKTTATHPQYASLVAYYKMDDASGTTLTDSKGANTGTLVSSPPWILSGAAIGDESSHDYGNGNSTTVTETHADGSNFTISKFSGVPAGAHVYLINEAPNSNTNSLSGNLEETRYYGTFVVGGTSPTHSVSYNYSGNSNIDGHANESEVKLTNRADNSVSTWSNYSNYFDMDDGSKTISKCEQSANMEYCTGFDNTILQERPGSGYTLDFNGSNNYISIPDADNLSFGNGITDAPFSVEAWVNLDVTTNQMIASKRVGGIDEYHFTLSSSGGLSVTLADESAGAFIFGETAALSLSTGVWYHVAFTYSGNGSNTGIKLYLNGSEQTNLLPGGSGTYTSMENTAAALELATFNSGNTNQMNGRLDEVKIWNTELSQSQIRSWMCKKTNSSHPQYCNLVSYYRFDENTGTTLTDYAGNNNGTLINSPTWTSSETPLGDESIFEYTVTNSTSINIPHANGDDMTVNVTTHGNADAIQLYRIDEAPNVTTPPSGLDEISGVNYWGVKTFGGTGTTYEVVYNYDGHPGIITEANLRLVSRANNAATAWTLESATLDEVGNTLTLGGQTGTQFSLGSTALNALPVELIDFLAIANHTSVDLKWSTASEVNNDYFKIQKSRSGNDWQTIERVDAQNNGNSNTINSYFSTDKSPFEGQSYYRLKQVDVDGKFTFSETESVVFYSTDENEISIFPNPADKKVNVILSSSDASNMKLKVLNLQGVEVFSLENHLEKGRNNFSIDVGNFAAGVYFLSIFRNGKMINKRFIVK